MKNHYTMLTGTLVEGVIDRNPEALSLIAPPPNGTAAERLAIYADGYRVRLADAVKSDYPALTHYMGEAVLDEWIGRYVEAVPSQSYSLDHYPFGFAVYLAAECRDDFAVDLAALEDAIAEVFLLPDSAPLLPQDVVDVEASVFTLRAAAQLLALRYPAEEYLAAERRGEAAAKPAAEEACYLIYRHENEVRRRRLSPFQYQLLKALDGMKSFADVVASLGETAEEDVAELQLLFAFALTEGVFRKEALNG